MPKEQYCSNILQSMMASMLAKTAAKATSTARPTININLPGKSKPEGSWASCVPVGGPWADQSGVLPPWGPGNPPVIDVHQGPASAYRDSSQCAIASKALARSVSSAISSVSSSRIYNMEFGPRARAATVTLIGGPCITHGVYRNGRIPNIYPAVTNAKGGANLPIIVTASPKPAVSPIIVQPKAIETVFVTITASNAPNQPSSYNQPGSYNQPQPGIGSNVGNIQHSEVSLETIGETVPCRVYPDLMTNDWDGMQPMNGRTRVTVDCWTSSSLPGMFGMLETSNI